MAIQEQAPRPPSQETRQEHEITLFVGEDRHPVSMACYGKERFYIGGLRAQLEGVHEETIVFAVTVETTHQGRITRRYDLTGEQFYHLLHGNEPVGFAYTGMLEATTRLSPSPEQPGQEHEQGTPPRTRSPIR